MKRTILLMLAMATTTVQAASPDEMVYEQVSQYVSEPEAGIIAQDICDASYEYDVDPILAAAVFTAESHFDNSAVSGAGAIGIAQLMPDTAASLGVNPYNEEDNIYGGVAYLGQMLSRYRDWDDPYIYAEAAYNAGPGAVDEAGGIPNYEETINYVDTVEGIRQDIWDKFGDGSYADYDADDGVYDTGSEAAEDPRTVNTQIQSAKSKKQPKQVEVPDTIRVWPPVRLSNKERRIGGWQKLIHGKSMCSEENANCLKNGTPIQELRKKISYRVWTGSLKTQNRKNQFGNSCVPMTGSFTTTAGSTMKTERSRTSLRLKGKASVDLAFRSGVTA